MDPTSTGPHYHKLTTGLKPKWASYDGTKTTAKTRAGANPSSAHSVGKAKVNHKSTMTVAELSKDERAVKKRRCMDGCEWRELTRAVLRFVEVYERVESSKQAWMLELEKEQIEIAKEVEFEWMNLLIDAQVKIVRRMEPESSATSTVS